MIRLTGKLDQTEQSQTRRATGRGGALAKRASLAKADYTPNFGGLASLTNSKPKPASNQASGFFYYMREEAHADIQQNTNSKGNRG